MVEKRAGPGTEVLKGILSLPAEIQVGKEGFEGVFCAFLLNMQELQQRVW